MLTRLMILMMGVAMNTTVLFDFSSEVDIRSWRIVNDTVMGGRSSCSFRLNDAGHGLFEGRVSLENNGGFSSVRHRFRPVNVQDKSKLVLRLKGDGKRYQIRIKDSSRRYYSYITYINTGSDWETFELELNDFYPYYRGYELNRPNFNHTSIEELSILIGNKKAERFQLLIDRITLK